MPQNHLITGGSGVLGRAIAKEIISKGERVKIFDLNPPKNTDTTLPCEFVKGDIRDIKSLESACRGYDVIHHLAACMPQSRLSREDFWKVNVGGTLNVAWAAMKGGARRIVFASSIEIYGPQRKLPLTEDSPKLFTGTYSRNKWECEEHLLNLRAEKGIEVVFLRMPMILGPGFYHEKAMTELFKRVKGGKLIPVPGKADAPFQCLASSDAAGAFVLASSVPRADGEAFNISAPDSPKTIEIMKKLVEAAGSSSKVIPLPVWTFYPAVKLIRFFNLTIPLINTPPELLEYSLVGGAYDISKARRILGYNPSKNCLDALLETYRWFIESRASSL